MSLTKVSTSMIMPSRTSSQGSVLTVVNAEIQELVPEESIQGVTTQSTYDKTTGRLQLVNPDGTVTIIEGFLTLNDLPAGREGQRGPEGRQGIKGRNGRDGRQGDQGCDGPKGDDGPIGPTGPTGPTGLRGFQGEIGPTGSTGPTGAPGLDGEEPEWIKGSNGVGIKLVRAGGMIMSGRFELNEVNRQTISLLFPKNFVNGVASLVLMFIDPDTYQAQHYTVGDYIMDDVEIGGVTIGLDGVIPSPLTDKWDFFWFAMGD